MNPLAQLRKGTTALAVLSALERGEVYGYGIRRETHRRTNGLFAINEGALYPLLHALERKKLVRARLEKVTGRWRRYYQPDRKRPPRTGTVTAGMDTPATVLEGVAALKARSLPERVEGCPCFWEATEKRE